MTISNAVRPFLGALPVIAWLLAVALSASAADAQTAPAAAADPNATGAAPPGVPQAPAATPAPGAQPAPSVDTSSAETITIESRPVALMKGSSTWDDAYRTINDTFQKINAALGKNGIKPTGRPIAMFTETDDNGFKFQGMVPIDKPAEKKSSLSPDIEIGELPAGKALKFHHRGAYDDIDSTYEAITAYLDERGYEAKNLFLEEYLNDAKGSDDTSLAVDIYVYVK